MSEKEHRGMKFLSVCSGIEAASVAWKPLGWEPVAFAEIASFPADLLGHRHPEVLNLGSLLEFETWPEELLAQVDVLIGGTPCQAYSVAGARGSLSDDRGKLSLTFTHLYERIEQAAKSTGRPSPVLLWENVPGVLNTADNAFGHFLGGLAGGNGPLQPPGGRWGNIGYVRGRNHAIAWRILDAQHFGLAQRRERVFLVCCAGDGPCPRKILFETEGVRRDSPPGRESREGVTGTLSARTRGGRGLGTDFELGGGLQPISAPITTSPYADNVSRESNLIPVGIPEIARCVTTGEAARQDYETCTIIPFPANLSGTNCPPSSGQNVSPTIQSKNPTAIAYDLNQVTSPANRSNPQSGAPCHTLPSNGVPPMVVFPPEPIAFSGRSRGDDGRGYDRPPNVTGDKVGALDTVKAPCVAFDLHGVLSQSVATETDIHTPLRSRQPGQFENSTTTVVSVALRGREGGCTAELGGDVANTLRAGDGGGSKGHVLAFRAAGQEGFTADDISPPVLASDGGGAGIPTVAHTLRGEGFDASEDGPGRGTPLVPFSLANLETACRNWNGNAAETNTIEKLRALRGKIGEKAFTEWGLGILDPFRASKVLRPEVHGEIFRRAPEQKHEMVNNPLSCPETGQSGPVRAVRKRERTGCSSPGRGPHEQHQHEPPKDLPELPQQAPQAKEFLRALWKASEGLGILRDALSAVQDAWRPAQSQGEYGVRRLTPRETERLQGFPDDYTLIPRAGGKLAADSPRYAAIGNSMAVPVIAWLGRRIQREVELTRGGVS